MIFYFGFFFVIITYVITSRYLWRKNSMISLIVPLIASVLFAGLRGNVGTDTFVYKTFFNTLWRTDVLADQGLKFAFEPGFVLFSQIIKSIYDNDQFYIFSLSCLFGFLFFRLLREIEEKDMFFLFYMSSFYIMFNLNLMRFGIAMILSGIAFLSKNNRKKIIYLLLAFSFHFSAIFIGFFFIKKNQIIKYIFVFLLIFFLTINFIESKINSYLVYFLLFSNPFQFELTILLEIVVMYLLITWNNISIKLNNLIFCIFLYFTFRTFGFLTDIVSRLSYVFGFTIYLSFYVNKLNLRSRQLIMFLVLFYTYRTLAFVNNSDGAMDNLLSNETGMSSLYSQTKWLPYKFFWEK